MTAALWPTSGGSPEKFVIRANASSPSAPVNQRSRSQLWAPHDAQAVCWRGSSFHSSPRAFRSHQPTSAPVTWIIRTSPIAPSSISRLAATGASRKRCCETTASRTPAARQASTISAHSVADWAIGFSTRRCLPAAAAASVWARWTAGGEARTTASTSSRASSASKVWLERDAEVGRQRRRRAARR